MFFGALFKFAISRPIVAGAPIKHTSPEEVVTQAVDIFAGNAQVAGRA
jgi:hypothetical protein